MATLKARARIEPGGARRELTGPTLPQMAANLTTAAIGIARSGFALAPKEIVDARLATCSRCEFWQDDARLGLGKCNHPRCGCTKAKHLFSASRCPMNHW